MDNAYQSLIHLYGVNNGLHFAAFVYVVFFALSYFFQESQRHVSVVFGVVSICFVFLYGFSISFQFAHNIPVIQLYPAWFAIFAKFAAPLVLALITLLFFRSIAVKSFHTFHTVQKEKTVLLFIYLICLVSFFAMFFVSDTRQALIVTVFSGIPVFLIYSYLTKKIIGKHSVGKMLLFGYALFILTAAHQLWILTENIELTPASALGIQLSYSLLFLWLSFSVIRFGYDEVKYYFQVQKLDKKKLMYQIYLAIRKQQFFLVYQPKLDVKTNQIVGVEALLRWKHPIKGIVMPNEFIPVAEKTGMINQICFWSIEEAVKQCRDFIDLGQPLPIALNFSDKNMHPKTMQFLKDALQKHQVPAQMIVIEINENCLMTQTPSQKEALQILNSMDVCLTIDDYGTGFSSLSHLSTLDLHEIKIDESFMVDIDKDNDNLIIVQSTLSMTQGLNIKAVAEGVESEAVIAKLTQLGCDVVQGNAVARPMRSSALINWLYSRNQEEMLKKQAASLSDANLQTV